MSLETVKAALAGFIQQVMGRVDFFALYPCVVVSQNSDGSLELKPDAPRFGAGLSRVPIRLGLPGVTVKVKPQARVMLAFEGGDPQRPVATLWEAAGLDELTVTAQTKVVVNSPNVWLGEEEGDAQPVARLGDTVELLFPVDVPGVPNLNGVIGVPPAAQPFAGTLTITDSLVGIITTSGSKVRAA